MLRYVFLKHCCGSRSPYAMISLASSHISCPHAMISLASSHISCPHAMISLASSHISCPHAMISLAFSHISFTIVESVILVPTCMATFSYQASPVSLGLSV